MRIRTRTTRAASLFPAVNTKRRLFCESSVRCKLSECVRGDSLVAFLKDSAAFCLSPPLLSLYLSLHSTLSTCDVLTDLEAEQPVHDGVLPRVQSPFLALAFGPQEQVKVGVHGKAEQQVVAELEVRQAVGSHPRRLTVRCRQPMSKRKGVITNKQLVMVFYPWSILDEVENTRV
jgi:hypothetical protein